MKFYDPPSGWQYGFPKPYQPREGESIRDTLIRDGYPPQLADQNWPIRFWEETAEESAVAKFVSGLQLDDEDDFAGNNHGN